MICYLFYLSGAYSSVPCRYLVNYRYDYMNFIDKLNHTTSKGRIKTGQNLKLCSYTTPYYSHTVFFFNWELWERQG